MRDKKITLGVIFGNRNFFPDAVVIEGRRDMLRLLEEMGIGYVTLTEDETKLGAVETWEDAKKCGALFRRRAEEIDGILVSLPNFGDEKGVAESIKLSGLHVPILVQAFPDEIDQFNAARRRDAFCGKISVCNNLYQYSYPFTVTEDHTVKPDDESFRSDLRKFVGVCRVVGGLKSARLGAVGARPNNFNTTRYSEKLLQSIGISVNTIDLSSVFGEARKLGDDHPRVREKLDRIQSYVPTGGVPAPSLYKMAKIGIVLDDWMGSLDLNATAIQCWDSLQLNYGVNVCTLMSMMSEQLMPSACEVDITGVVSMYALQLASGTPSALVDWNNNYGGDPDKCVLFHCGNWASSFFSDFQMESSPILGSTLGQENTFGVVGGRTPAGLFSYARVTTDDRNGKIKTYVGDGMFVDDPLETFGSRAVVEVPQLQGLLKHICKNGFEHHAAMNTSHSADILKEAFETYFGWETYHHVG
jgi:L-fucose isomerase-like protein